MKSILDRRNFIRLCSATAALLTAKARPQQPPAAPAPRIPRTPAKVRKNYVGIQVRAFAWQDEGVDAVLDNLQQKGNVNTIWAYTFGYGEQRLRQGSGFPDHGKPLAAGETGVVAGAYYDYNPKYFQNTTIRDFRAKGYGDFNVIEQVAPKAKARGMDFIAWDLNNPSVNLPRIIPNYATVSEVDMYGRRTTNPCFNHPDFRAYLSGKVESVLIDYASHVDGYAWGCERIGPLDSMLGGAADATCFCQFCQARGREQGISVARAQAGFIELSQLFHATARDGVAQRPLDGYFVTFWRLLLKYPEILAWESLWIDSFHEAQAGLYGLGKSLAPQKPFGFHLLQTVTFSPFYRAEEDFTKRRNFADFIKIATYNNAGGPRMTAYLESLGRTVFRDATPQDFTPLYYKMMNYQEAPFDQLASAGLSPGYVVNEIERAMAGVAGQTKIYPGIDIDVPILGGGPKTTDKRTKPEDVKRTLEAVFAAKADGVVLCREYAEMWLANLTAAGDALREIFAHHPTPPAAGA